MVIRLVELRSIGYKSRPHPFGRLRSVQEVVMLRRAMLSAIASLFCFGIRGTFGQSRTFGHGVKDVIPSCIVKRVCVGARNGLGW